MKTHLNLLPLRYRRRRLRRQRLAAWSVVWGVAALLGGGMLWGEYRQYNARRAQLESRQDEYAPIEELRGDLELIREQTEQLKQQLSLALSLADEHAVVLVVGAVSRAASQCRGELVVEHFSLARQRMGRRARAGDGAPTARMRQSLTLRGLAVNDPAVLSFVKNLQEQDVFERVELKLSKDVPAPSGRAARSYWVECVL